MSERIHFFQSKTARTALSLPFDLGEALDSLHGLRSIMARKQPPAFTRDEWAYLISFLDRGNLLAPFELSFGQYEKNDRGSADWLARPRGPVALWLPNNVSLLGPLTLILLSLTGNPIRTKGGSLAQDLAGDFLSYMIENIREGLFKDHLVKNVDLSVFDKADERNLKMTVESAVRIVFGSNEASESIDRLPHPVLSIGIPFVDRQSESWIEPETATDEILLSLIKIFAIYGQAGCTSPRRVVLFNATDSQVIQFRDRLSQLWGEAVPVLPEPHVASNNVMARQLAAALGWDAIVAPNHAAVLAIGTPELPTIHEPMTLSLVCATPEIAAANLASNIQTIGHSLRDPDDPKWLALLAKSAVKRFVPIGSMHHFGPVWDGYEFWRQTFEQVEIRR